MVDKERPSKDVYMEFSQAVNSPFHSTRGSAEGIKGPILERYADGHHVITGTSEENMGKMPEVRVRGRDGEPREEAASQYWRRKGDRHPQNRNVLTPLPSLPPRSNADLATI